MGGEGGVQWWLDQDNFHCNLNVLIFIIQCQRLEVDFVLPLSQEEQEEEEQQEEPPTKIYQKEVHYGLEIWHPDFKSQN